MRLIVVISILSERATNNLTLQAFASYIFNFSAKFRKEIVSYQCEQQTNTILEFVSYLQDNSLYHQLHLLNDILNDCIVVLNENNNSQSIVITNKIIDTIYIYLCNGVYFTHSLHFQFLLDLFIVTIQPYIDILDLWITHGIIRDPFFEFFIKSDQLIVTGNDNINYSYWNNAFIINKSTPLFLTNIINRLITGGKSIHILNVTHSLHFNNITTNNNNNNNNNNNDTIDSLYKTFLSNLLMLFENINIDSDINSDNQINNLFANNNNDNNIHSNDNDIHNNNNGDNNSEPNKGNNRSIQDDNNNSNNNTYNDENNKYQLFKNIKDINNVININTIKDIVNNSNNKDIQIEEEEEEVEEKITEENIILNKLKDKGKKKQINYNFNNN